ncbi:MAG: hypothetical protein MMC33_010176 [Icmadophila ericetorum]|nr:hypothetical protein [Icmadophila ericetorum]
MTENTTPNPNVTVDVDARSDNAQGIASRYNAPDHYRQGLGPAIFTHNINVQRGGCEISTLYDGQGFQLLPPLSPPTPPAQASPHGTLLAPAGIATQVPTTPVQQASSQGRPQIQLQVPKSGLLAALTRSYPSAPKHIRKQNYRPETPPAPMKTRVTNLAVQDDETDDGDQRITDGDSQGQDTDLAPDELVPQRKSQSKSRERPKQEKSRRRTREDLPTRWRPLNPSSSLIQRYPPPKRRENVGASAWLA